MSAGFEPPHRSWSQAQRDSMIANTLCLNRSTTGIARMTRDDLGPIATVRYGDFVGGREKASVKDELVSIMDQYESPLYAYLLSILHDRDLAVDCAQDTFLRAYEALNKGKTINRKWLY